MSNFKVTIFWPGKVAKWVIPWLEAVELGFKNHGIMPSLSDYKSAKSKPDVNCDLAVFWSHRPYHIIETQRERGLDYIALERGYIGPRTEWTAFCLNGLNGHADWSHCENSPPDRFLKYHSDKLKPYRLTSEGNILIIGQVNGDESVKGIDLNIWYKKIANEFKEFFPNSNIVLRHHPCAVNRAEYNELGMGGGASLQDAFNRASAVVTLNSNTGVESVFEGIPTFTFDEGAMAWSITQHEPSTGFEMIDRSQWAHDLAYKQWTLEEIKSGLSWEHLKNKLI